MGTQVSIDLDVKKDVWSTQILCFVDIGYWEQTASRIYLTRFPITDFAEISYILVHEHIRTPSAFV